MNKLVVSEMFYSIQGEGPSAGKLAVFLRLAACNLQCAGFSYVDPVTGEHLGCDTKAVWRRGERFNSLDIISSWKQNGYLDALANGARLVITGGEPLLQQEGLIEWFMFLHESLGILPSVEIETNATRLIKSELLPFLTQINASPKLTHSGETRLRAYVPAVLQQFAELPQAIFKFVIASPRDIDEVLRDYVETYELTPQRIWLMAEGGTEKTYRAKRQWLVELCKRYHMNYSPRLHIDIWDEATGV